MIWPPSSPIAADTSGGALLTGIRCRSNMRRADRRVPNLSAGLSGVRAQTHAQVASIPSEVSILERAA